MRVMSRPLPKPRVNDSPRTFIGLVSKLGLKPYETKESKVWNMLVVKRRLSDFYCITFLYLNSQISIFLGSAKNIITKLFH